MITLFPETRWTYGVKFTAFRNDAGAMAVLFRISDGKVNGIISVTPRPFSLISRRSEDLQPAA